MTDPIVIDFETHAIKQRPAYPPKPVGVSIRWPGKKSWYLAWGHHPDGYNADAHKLATRELHAAWESGLPLLFHNAKFDLEVAEKWFGLPMPDWRRVHDTQFLAFLADPHAPQLGLKPLAESWLKWPPEERDALTDWIMDHKAMLQQLDPSVPVTRKNAGAWIWAVPSLMVKPYAEGDTDRTLALYREFMPLIQDYGMTEAYDRERRLMPILLRNEQEGMRLDQERIGQDIEKYGAAFDRAESQMRAALKPWGVKDGLNFDADQDVAEALLSAGLVLEADLTQTKSGGWSVSKDNLRPEMFQGEFGRQFAQALGYRNRLKTCLDMFMRPWAAQAAVNNGRISTNWNQTRNPGGGTRTGRPSTNGHNFLNIAKEFGKGRDSESGYHHPDFLSVPPLPLCRVYVLPDEGCTFIHRDFDGQELRVFAHFEQGDLWQAYHADPRTDPHAFVKAGIAEVTGRELERDPVKVLNFQGLYGGGIPALKNKLRCTDAEARELKMAHDAALPGRKILVEEIKRFVRQGLPIRTWGGRLYFCEPPGLDGRSKDYKLINYLIQGSAAELTKEALIAWDSHPLRQARFLVTVYDEINGSAPSGDWETEMAILKDVMEETRISVPMLSSGKRGRSWGELEKCA